MARANDTTRATLFILVTATLLIAPTATAQTLTATLQTQEPITLQGTTSIQDANGLAATWPNEASLTLYADTLELDTHWAQGERVENPDGNGLILIPTDQGQETTRLNNAILTATPWQQEGQLVAEPNQRTHITAQATKTATLTATDEEHLAWEGHKDEQASTNDHPHHESKIQTPTLLLDGADHAKARGQLTLFINNATLDAQAQDGETWSDWTGHRTQQTGPTERYETRITTITAINATLSLLNPTTLTLLGDALTLDTQGTLTLTRTHGTLTPMDQDPLHLEPTTLTLAGDATTHAAPHEQDPDNVHLDTTGDLEIVHATDANLQALNLQPENAHPFLTWILPLLALLALLLIGATVPIKHPKLLQYLPEHHTEGLYRRWRQKGLQHEANERYEKAARTYAKLTDLRPRNPFPWYLLARSQLHAGNPEATIQTIHDAKQNAETIPRDIHEVHILALWDANRHDKIPTALDQIAQTDPDTAISLAHDLELYDLLTDHDEAWWTNAQPARGQGIDGYA